MSTTKFLKTVNPNPAAKAIDKEKKMKYKYVLPAPGLITQAQIAAAATKHQASKNDVFWVCCSIAVNRAYSSFSDGDTSLALQGVLGYAEMKGASISLMDSSRYRAKTYTWVGSQFVQVGIKTKVRKPYGYQCEAHSWDIENNNWVKRENFTSIPGADTLCDIIERATGVKSNFFR